MPRQSPSVPVRHLTVRELADRLRVTPDYLYRDVLNQEDGIRPIRLGHGRRARLRIPLSEVERWENKRRM